MRSRSRSRERTSFRRRSRSRSRSPRKTRPEDRRDKDATFIKKERTEDKYRSRVKSEPIEDESKKFGKPSKPMNEEEQKEPEKPSFELSGNLMQDTNVFNGVVIKYA